MKNEITFEQFWNRYGYKRDRISAERAWKRLSAKDKRAAMDGIEAYRKDCAASGRMMCYAQGYINRRRWEDDFATSGENQTMVNVQCSMLNDLLSPAEERERDDQERNRRYDERVSHMVSREEAMKSEEYRKAMEEC